MDYETVDAVEKPKLVMENLMCRNKKMLATSVALSQCAELVVVDKTGKCANGKGIFMTHRNTRACHCCTTTDALTNTKYTTSMDMYDANQVMQLSDCETNVIKTLAGGDKKTLRFRIDSETQGTLFKHMFESSIKGCGIHY